MSGRRPSWAPGPGRDRPPRGLAQTATLALTVLLLAYVAPLGPTPRPSPPILTVHFSWEVPGMGSPRSAASAPAAGSGSNWTALSNRSAQVAPAPRAYEALTYDVADGYAVLFGGLGPSGPLGDTWAYRSNWTWTPIPGAVAPSARWGASSAYDPAAQEVVLFGGALGANLSSPSASSETWEFAHGAWRTLNLSYRPPARWGAALMTAPNGTGVVLFGGHDAGGSAYNDTWYFSAEHWTNLTASAGAAPTPRWWSAATNLSRSGIDLLFGGNSTAGTALGDTWSFGSAGWHRLFRSSAPIPRVGASLAYDQIDGVAVLFGGTTTGGVPLSMTYPFTGSSWGSAYLPPTHPAARAGAGFAWLGGFGQGIVLLFGGASGTNTFYSGSWAYGSNTPLYLGVPKLGFGNIDPGIVESFSANQTGGFPPIHYAWTGLPLNCTGPDAMNFTCVPGSTGSIGSFYSPRVTGTDSRGTVSTSPPAALKVNAELIIEKLLLEPAAVLVGTNLSIEVVKAGGAVNANFSYPSLPPGCQSTNLSNFSCQPNRTGTFLVEALVIDPFGARANASGKVVVTAPGNRIPWSTALLAVTAAAAVVVLLLAVLVLQRRSRRRRPPIAPASGPPPG